jgi:PAS domain S-box-containing protein
MKKGTANLPVVEMERLIDELRIHQIELEAQNEELRVAKEEASQAVEKYTELYDFAPLGYYSIIPDGTICELNLMGAQMLGVERSNLIKRNIRFFIAPKYLPVFNEFLRKSFESDLKQVCEVKMELSPGSSFYFHFDGLVSEDKQRCFLTAVDITAIRNATKMLHSNFEILRIAGKAAKYGGWSIDIRKNKLIWSDEVAAILEMPFGHSPEFDELISFYTPEWHDKISNVISDCVNKGTSFDEELEVITAKGKRIWVRTIGEAIRNKSGKITKVQGAFQDITERKHTEEALYASETRFRTLLQDVSSVSVQGYAPDGTTQYWNKASEKLYGYTAEEAIGQNLLDLIIPPEMRPDVQQAIELMAETAQTIPSSELSLMRKDGSRVSVYSSHAIVESPGKPNELFCIDIDLTELKQAENEILKRKQQYDNLVANIPVGVYILHTKPEGLFSLDYVSPRMAVMLGLSIESLIADASAIFEAIHPDDLESFIRLNQEGIKLKRPFNWKGRVVVKKEIKWLHILSLPQELESGDTLWHGLIVDITERILAEEEIKQQNEELVRLNATKDRFFSIIAHDLRGPFSSFLGLTQIMAGELPSLTMTQVQDIAMRMSKSATNLYRLLENLLEWSQIQRGAFPFNPEVFQLGLVISGSIDMINESAKNKDIEITTDIAVGLEVFADKDMTQTIIRNLVSNAVKYTHKGGKVKVSVKTSGEKNVEISIWDSGIGMSQTLIDNLFRTDIKMNRLGTEGEPSTGLGLLLCKEFVEKQGGKIWAESEAGKGSVFSFTIPISIN